jgi:hypothetical protein
MSPKDAPLTSAVCSLEEIRCMFDEMAAAERPYLPEFLLNQGKYLGWRVQVEGAARV